MPSIFDKLFKRKTADVSATPAVAPARDAEPSTGDFEILFAKAGAAVTGRDLSRAIQLYDQAIAADPLRPEAYYKRANVLKDLGQLEAAIAGYDEAIQRRPDYAHAHCNRGFVQHALRRLPEALASYDKAIALQPTDIFSHYNRALLMQELCRWEEAVAGYTQAIAIDPKFADAQYNRAVGLLYLGDYENGWQGYEWRWLNAQRLGIGAHRCFQQPLWLGTESLEGKRLLVHSEAGLGDVIQFSRYASLCAARGATVLLETHAPLVKLLSSLEGVSEVLANGTTLPAFDCHCPVMSLPLAFKTTLDTVPAPPTYLHSPPDEVAHWRSRLGKRQRPRVGLTWSGNPNNPIDARRSIVLAEWVAHLPREFEYFRLQRDVREHDRKTLNSTDLIASVDELQDFTTTAALCECMDLIITVDTSVAHLSAALGRKTWILLAHTPDWRWMRDRLDSPWYPNVKLYRQRVAGDWQEVLARVVADMGKELL